jgi:hypothetical protein
MAVKPFLDLSRVFIPKFKVPMNHLQDQLINEIAVLEAIKMALSCHFDKSIPNNVVSYHIYTTPSASKHYRQCGRFEINHRMKPYLLVDELYTVNTECHDMKICVNGDSIRLSTTHGEMGAVLIDVSLHNTEFLSKIVAISQEFVQVHRNHGSLENALKRLASLRSRGGNGSPFVFDVLSRPNES